MKRPILSEYGPEASGRYGSRESMASGGGKIMPKPLPYSPPCGPKNNMSPGPGLKGGTNHGTAGTQGKR